MKHQTNREFGFERWFVAALLAAMAAGRVDASGVQPDDTVASTLSCLERTNKPPQFVEGTSRQDRGLMRVKLTFDRPDQAPIVEVLANTATKSMQDQVLQFVNGYRLPCLKGEQGSVQAVQDFAFEGYVTPDGRPLRPLSQQLPPNTCIVEPNRTLTVNGTPQDGVVKVIAQGRFDGDADQPPTITYLYTSGSLRAQRYIGEHLAAFRMPCRKPGDPPVVFEKTFVALFNGSKQASFNQKLIPLSQFLAYMQGWQDKRVYFDLNTMDCPFKLNWTSMRPVAANRVREFGMPNPNRTELLTWLSSMELKMSDQLRDQLLAESLVIDVPCGKLDLKPSSPPANPT